MRLCDSCNWMKPNICGDWCELLNRPCPQWKTCKNYRYDCDKENEVDVYVKREREKRKKNF